MGKKKTQTQVVGSVSPPPSQEGIYLIPHPAKKNKETKYKYAVIWGAALVPKT